MVSESTVLDFNIQLSLAQFDLDVQLQAGPELVVIFGPSGAGKSLTLRALAGLVTPDSGYVRVAGRTWFDSSHGVLLPPQARRVGYVPQNYALFPHLNVADNVAFGLHRLSKGEARQRVDEILSIMRLESHACSRPSELSGGQQQRVALARALVTEPQLLLMDEPLAALESSLREHLRRELRAVQTRFCIPTLLITHDLAEAYSLAQQLAVLSGGRIVQAGPREVVFRQPATPDVARVLGMTNILQAQVEDTSEAGLTVGWAGLALRIANQQLPSGDGGLACIPGQPIVLGIRPEEIMFVRSDRPVRDVVRENWLAGEIIADDPQGLDHHLTLAVQGPGAQEQAMLRIRLPHPVYLRLGLAVGQTRVVALKSEAIHVFPC
jgi:molybdate transport system ATP-binding protein